MPNGELLNTWLARYGCTSAWTPTDYYGNGIVQIFGQGGYPVIGFHADRGEEYGVGDRVNGYHVVASEARLAEVLKINLPKTGSFEDAMPGDNKKGTGGSVKTGGNVTTSDVYNDAKQAINSEKIGEYVVLGFLGLIALKVAGGRRR